jgi:hypothetical protein
MKTLLIIMVLACTTASASQDTKLIIGVGSFHYRAESREYLNQENPAIGLEVYDVKVVYTTKNSWGTPSVYATYAPTFYSYKAINLSYELGMATGYKCTNEAVNNGHHLTIEYCTKSGVVPVVGITVHLDVYNGLGVDYTLTPTVAIFSLTYDF